MNSEAKGPPSAVERLAFVRAQLRFELGLLHERVNALVAAEAFLTIAYTTAMSNGARWGATFSAVVSPILSVLGLLLALLAWPGVATTVRLVRGWTASQSELLQDDAARLLAAMAGLPGRDPVRDQRRSMLFFQAVPGLFVLVWAALTVVALALPARSR
jgi:hypothetical protein